MRNKPLRILIFLFMIALFGSVAIAGHGDPGTSHGGETIPFPNPLNNCAGNEEQGFMCVVENILNGLLILATPLVVLMVLVGGFMIMASGGSPEKLEKGKKTLTWAIVGYVILLLGRGIAEIIQNVLGDGSGGGRV